MKILIYNWRDIRHSWAGGGEIYIFEQAKRWVKKGHSVTLFCGENFDTHLPDEEVIDGITIIRKGGRYTVYLYGIIYYVTRFRNRFDILIDVINGIPFFSPLFSRIPVLGVIYHIHGHQFFYELPFPLSYIGYAIEKYVIPIIYRHTPVIAISKTTKKQLISHGHKEHLIHIVKCGINGVSRMPKKETKFKHPTILYLGRIKKYKRVDLLVNVFPEIIKRVPHARLVIAGWGTEASNVANIVMKSSLRRKISLVGPVSSTEKNTLLTKSWVFVNPSIGEGWSLAVIEANLYGTPAIGFRVSGLSESIQHGKTGLLANSHEEFVQHICTLLLNPQLKHTLSKNAQRWSKQFNWDKTAHRSMKIFTSIIALSH